MKKTLIIIAVLFAAISFNTYAQYIPLRNSDVRQIANGDTSRFYITGTTTNWLTTNPVVLNNNFWTTGTLTANGATTLTSIVDIRDDVTMDSSLTVTGNTTLGDATTDRVMVNGDALFNNNVNILGTTTLGSATASQYLFNLYNSSADTACMFFTNITTGQLKSQASVIGIDNSKNLFIKNNENAVINFHTNKLQRMQILGTGEVGIGVTPSTLYQLYVTSTKAGAIINNSTNQTLVLTMTSATNTACNQLKITTACSIATPTTALTSSIGTWIKCSTTAQQEASRLTTGWLNTVGDSYWKVEIDSGGAGSTALMKQRILADTLGVVLTGKIVNNGSLNFGIDAQVSDAYIVTITGLTRLDIGHSIYFYAATANTGACTLNGKALKVMHDQDPPDSWIEAGSIIHAIYDGTNYQIMTPDANP